MPVWTWALVLGIPLFTLALVGAILFAVGFALTRGLSWKALRWHYGTPPAFHGRRVSAGVFRLNHVRIKRCFTSLGLADDGLYLFGISFIGMPPVRIPWSDVVPDPNDPNRLLLGPNRTPLVLRSSLHQRVLAHRAAALAGADAKGPAVKATPAAAPPDRCPYCHDQLSGVLGACVACGTQHHAECLTENNGCAVLACDAGPQRQPQTRQKA